MIRPIASRLTLPLVGLLLAACQSTPETGAPADPLPILQRINDTAQRCWVKSGDPLFRDYRVVPELDTRTGRPRVLVVRAGAASGLPALVIEIDGGAVSAYGPLQQSTLAGRINADIVRWANGRTGCEA